jgi:hypothetical protein
MVMHGGERERDILLGVGRRRGLTLLNAEQYALLWLHTSQLHYCIS